MGRRIDGWGWMVCSFYGRVGDGSVCQFSEEITPDGLEIVENS